MGSDLSCADFQTPTFLESFPIPLFPGEDALWTPGPKSSWGFFFKPDSWAWGFRGLFNASFGVESSDPEFVVKGHACARGQVRAAVNAKKAALQRLVCRVFGFLPNARTPKFERWLSPVFLGRNQIDQDGACRFDAAVNFVVWYFGGKISVPVVGDAIQGW